MHRTLRSAFVRTAWLLAAAGASFFPAAPAQALELRVLSAGAVEPGMRPALTAFERASGHVVRIAFAAAPELRTALAASAPAAADVVVVPRALLDEIAASAPRAPIGRVGVGVAVREGAALPDIGSADALRAALMNADSVVFNRASTGAYVETMLRKLGIADAVDAKATRVADGAAVMRRLQAGTAAREIGFGAMTEVLLFRDQGIRLVGPLPPALQNHTSYVAVPWPGSVPADAARAEAVAALMRHLQGAEMRAVFAAAGIEPAP